MNAVTREQWAEFRRAIDTIDPPEGLTQDTLAVVRELLGVAAT